VSKPRRVHLSMRDRTTACGKSTAGRGSMIAHWNRALTTCPECIKSGSGQVLLLGEMGAICGLFAAFAGVSHRLISAAEFTALAASTRRAGKETK
jgi:hypothetical protein